MYLPAVWVWSYCRLSQSSTIFQITKHSNNGSKHLFNTLNARIPVWARVKVLVVEDNTDMRQAVVSYLRANGYIVFSVGNGWRSFAKDLQLQAEIALLDISLPGMTGLDITQRLRQSGFDGPIIALTARDSIDDKLLVLRREWPIT
jgi:CheY-like chemotaxis protein